MAILALSDGHNQLLQMLALFNSQGIRGVHTVCERAFKVNTRYPTFWDCLLEGPGKPDSKF